MMAGAGIASDSASTTQTGEPFLDSQPVTKCPSPAMDEKMILSSRLKMSDLSFETFLLLRSLLIAATSPRPIRKPCYFVLSVDQTLQRRYHSENFQSSQPILYFHLVEE